jgi:DNA mismatch endonuclease Vsr
MRFQALAELEVRPHQSYLHNMTPIQNEPVSAERSRLMARIRRSDTKPERIVRSMLHRLGYRFRTQYKGMPGRPDIAFPGRRKAIQVHGCFWHQHPGCRHARIPATRREFWEAKFERNRERDARLLSQANQEGWDVLTLWECAMADTLALEDGLVRFLGPARDQSRRRPLPKARGRA